MPGDEAGAAPTDQLRINIDEKAAWSDVGLAVDAAAKAGYTEALFAFGAKSKLTAPAGVPDFMTSADAASQANKALILKGARSVHTGRPLDASVLVGQMAQAWDDGMAAVDHGLKQSR